MASTPSASALSAVLRCPRGRSLWSRNPPSPRPPGGAGYSPCRGPLLLPGRRGPRGGLGDDDLAGAATTRTTASALLCRGHAHSSSGVESAPVVRSLTRQVRANLPAVTHGGCGKRVRGFEPQGRAAGGLRVSFTTPPCLHAVEAGHVSVVLTGSKRAPLLSQLVDLRAVVLWRSGDDDDDGAQHVLLQHNNNNNNNNTDTEQLQDQGRIHSPTDEDSPD